MNGTGLVAMTLFAVFAAGTTADTLHPTSLEAGIEQLRAGYRAWDARLLEQAAETLEKAAGEHPQDYAAAYWLGDARFHVVLHDRNAAGASRNAKESARLLHEAQTALKRAAELNPRDAEANAMRGVLAGMEIDDSPVRSLWKGPLIQQCLRQALRYGADNPRVQYLRGACLLEGPDALGGPKKALECLLEAERLFAGEASAEEKEAGKTFSWGRDHCLAFIGRAYARAGDASAAREYFVKALEIAPETGLARRSLEALQEGTEHHD